MEQSERPNPGKQLRAFYDLFAGLIYIFIGTVVWKTPPKLFESFNPGIIKLFIALILCYGIFRLYLGGRKLWNFLKKKNE